MDPKIPPEIGNPHDPDVDPFDAAVLGPGNARNGHLTGTDGGAVPRDVNPGLRLYPYR